MLANYKRESSLRHQSERLLDNNIYKFHKKMVNDKVKKLKMMDQDMKKKLEDKQRAQIKVKEEAGLKSKAQGEFFLQNGVFKGDKRF